MLRVSIPDMYTYSKLVAMIALGKQVAFDYDGKLRVAEIHALGTSAKDGKLLLRAYQLAGEASSPLPTWRMFAVEKITNIRLLDTPSQAPRPQYAENDRQMVDVFAQVASDDTTP